MNNEMRNKLWDRKFPGVAKILCELIGNDNPSPKDIADWKTTWIDNGNVVRVTNYAKASKLCGEIGIHYNLFQYMHRGEIGNDNISRSLVFYFEEDEIMFKMAKHHEI